ncbi:HemK2/MTQ2 family protein methyltransferase [Streptomyces sp. Da 82-17]|uniref:HemK2/MTQ2 family protein methyltransferase n=1 Tax=Streptomyces sp. Da 82-17 TaxID=3377116 RepID=UPI0038D3D018
MAVDTVLRPRLSRLITAPGVYVPQYDSGLLARALAAEDVTAATDVLDLGTGNGCLALCAARRGARVTAVDISRRAVLVTRVNAALAGLRLTVCRGDLTDAVPGRTYDLVVSNPPYVPSPAGPPQRGAARAWEAGPDGRAVVDRICDAAPRVLRPGGVLLMVHSALTGPDATLARLAASGLDTTVVRRARVPFGPVLRSRRGWLGEQGLVNPDVHQPPDEQEELVVFRARLR